MHDPSTLHNRRLIHDVATMMAATLLETFGPCLRDKEKHDALVEFYRICEAGIESYLIQRHRAWTRLHPSNN